MEILQHFDIDISRVCLRVNSNRLTRTCAALDVHVYNAIQSMIVTAKDPGENERVKQEKTLMRLEKYRARGFKVTKETKEEMKFWRALAKRTDIEHPSSRPVATNAKCILDEP
mmetsp:Transcript_23872/g.44604  ORF Transcript_23872/g.44604 Transcript_23872/m.44604 type:complete len:113 (-) Transcript_23872:397-735(-)|eukprot:CAMPEP_0170169624 /NCGR_PEP_ID=MMETSP0040_2-20121228/2543_1 /TAXON_ID=641309 /ORGANISM="Lotharella oceanica, Strain CCMP622" /LENGTH=112 /DNA_ID=CAMNT_0010408471 /DNA_START=249 /DNA_END=587 /DNA_ORIENTATION=+